MGSGSSSIPQSPTIRLPYSDSRHWSQVHRFLDPIVANHQLEWEEVISALSEIVQLSGHSDPGRRAEFTSLYEFIKQTRGHYLKVCAHTAEWALSAPQLFEKHPVSLLAKNTDSEVTLTREQVRCLLALMFWGAFPKRAREEGLPRDFTFVKVLTGQGDVQLSKIYCLFTYFYSAQIERDQRKLEFYRVHSEAGLPNHDCRMGQLDVIEHLGAQLEEIPSAVKVDFANKWFGGGVVTHGSAQEECMLLAYVEPIVGVLFTEQLQDNEVLYIRGARLFNRYTGFTNTFRWVAGVERPTADESIILAMDAEDYRRRVDYQYTTAAIKRDFMKAYIGFLAKNTKTNLSILTGNWGCGVFEGNPQLKFLLQWVAASFCQRSLVYVTFGRPELQDAQLMVNCLAGASPRTVLQMLCEYERAARYKTVFQYIGERMAGERGGVSQGGSYEGRAGPQQRSGNYAGVGLTGGYPTSWNYQGSGGQPGMTNQAPLGTGGQTWASPPGAPFNGTAGQAGQAGFSLGPGGLAASQGGGRFSAAYGQPGQAGFSLGPGGLAASQGGRSIPAYGPPGGNQRGPAAARQPSQSYGG